MIDILTRRRGLSRALRALVWLGLLVLAVEVRPVDARRRVHAARSGASVTPVVGPNLLILIGDDHRAGTLGIDGDPRRATPCLDRLARQGTRFDRAFCNAPVCTASRQSLITGRLPHALGVNHLLSRLPDDAVTLGDWLGDFGYNTAAYGKLHFNSEQPHGFAERLDLIDWERWLKKHSETPYDRCVPWRPFRDPAAVWLNASCQPSGLPQNELDSTYFTNHAIEYLGRHHTRPFALVVSFYDPHAPFKFPAGWPGASARRVHGSRDFGRRSTDPTPRLSTTPAGRLSRSPGRLLFVALVPRPRDRPDHGGARRLGAVGKHDRRLPGRQRLSARRARPVREALLLRPGDPGPLDPPLAPPHRGRTKDRRPGRARRPDADPARSPRAPPSPICMGSGSPPCSATSRERSAAPPSSANISRTRKRWSAPIATS